VLARVRGFPAPAGPIDLDVCVGDVVVLRGPNGSGKTSLLRALAGLDAPLRPDSVELGGDDPGRLPAGRLAQRVRVALHDPHATLVGLTVAGEFRLRGRRVPTSLSALAHRDVATLSSGQARATALAVADNNAPLLLLDEPVEGLDAARRAGLLALVEAARRRGAVVAADHAGLLDGLATKRIDLGPTGPSSTERRSPSGNAPILRADTASVARGETPLRLPALDLPAGLHGLAGPNGSGKSTLLLRLAGLLPAEGVRISDDPPRPGDNVRLLLPHAGDLLSRATVRDELAGGDPHSLVPTGLLDRHPLTLSAGEAQRVALAKVLAPPAPPLVLLDEPEAYLDADGRARMMAAVADLAALGCCVVAATHDEDLLAACASVVRLEGP